MKLAPPPAPGHDPGPPGPSAVTLLVALVLLVGGGWFLTHKLRDSARLEDCLMQGRTNCAPIAPTQ